VSAHCYEGSYWPFRSLENLPLSSLTLCPMPDSQQGTLPSISHSVAMRPCRQQNPHIYLLCIESGWHNSLAITGESTIICTYTDFFLCFRRNWNSSGPVPCGRHINGNVLKPGMGRQNLPRHELLSSMEVRRTCWSVAILQKPNLGAGWRCLCR